MKLNLRVRLKNPLFVAASVAELVTIVYTFCRLTGIEIPLPQEEVLYLAGLVVALLVSLGILQDATTPGLQDSDRAMGYKEPGK